MSLSHLRKRPVETCSPALAALVAGTAFLMSATGAAGAEDMVPADVLAPHRAVYDLTLEGRGDGSNIETLTGRVVLEYVRTECRGFTQVFRQVMSVTDSDGQKRLIDFRSTTFEDDLGTEFAFDSVNSENGDEQPHIRGAARRGEDGRVNVELAEPEARTASLDPSVLFPTQHLRRILASARVGSMLLDVSIFDGSEPGDTASPTLTIIGATQQPQEFGADELARQRGLDKLPHWPMTISYFDPPEKADGEQLPRLVQDLDVYENGVWRSVRLDYGSYVVAGKLVALDYIARPECEPK